MPSHKAVPCPAMARAGGWENHAPTRSGPCPNRRIMFTLRKAGRGLIAVLLATPLLGAAGGTAAASTTGAPIAVASVDTAPDVRTPSGQVTLVTGDRLSLTANGQVSVLDNPS